MLFGYSSGISRRKKSKLTWAAALTPMRSQRGFSSGSSAKRAAIGRVPIAFFQASGFPARRRFSNPTPRVVSGGGSAIIVVIRAASAGPSPVRSSADSAPRALQTLRKLRDPYQYQSTDADSVARIGLSYQRREVANVPAFALEAPFRNEPGEAFSVAGGCATPL